MTLAVTVLDEYSCREWLRKRDKLFRKAHRVRKPSYESRHVTIGDELKLSTIDGEHYHCFTEQAVIVFYRDIARGGVLCQGHFYIYEGAVFIEFTEIKIGEGIVIKAKPANPVDVLSLA